MDSAISKKTQDTLGKIIKKPPLTEKLLSKPPFRFLHDIVTSVIKTTGFMKGLYSEADMNSENVKDKDAKVAFLQKAIDMVAAVTGKNIAAKPIKIVAGHEPERTNEFLQVLAGAINAGVNNDEYVKKVLSGGGSTGKEVKKEEKREKKDDKERSHSASRRKDDKESRPKEKSQEREQAQEKKPKEKGGEGGGAGDEKDRDRQKDRREKSRDREDRPKDRDRDKDRDRRSRKIETEEKENDAPEQNVEKESSQRPTSAKGSRRRRQGREARDDEDEEFQQRETLEPAIGENDLPPQIANARKLARPPSARPAPPRPKQEGLEAEPAMRLGTGAPANLIIDDGKQDDDEENFLVEEAAPQPPPPVAAPVQGDADDNVEHGALVKKMLESKEKAEKLQQKQPTKKTEIERPSVSDAQRRKQRELVAKEIERLQSSIQALTRSANPLGKIMDYVQEDMDSMQKELDRWRAENKEHALALRREKNVTDRAIEPLKAQLTDLDRAISDQLDLIAACKSNILRNDTRIQKMLQGVARS